jgi:3-hydroxyanthranilate 3,4-dioxygenase
LVPVIKEYFASEEHKTGRPIPGSSIPETLPYEVDMVRVTQEPFNLKNW